MKKNYTVENGIKIRKSRFPISMFWMYFGACTLMSGVHVGLIVGMNKFGASDLLQVHVMLLYWILVAAGLTLYTRKRIERVYEIPLTRISEATKKVARGDFSVYIEPTNTPDKTDYLDVMIADLNRMIEELGSIETMKTDFVSNVSHEMKTPIAVIKNAAQLLQMEGAAGENAAEYLENIGDAAERLSNLITNILKLNKLENQKILPEMRDYDVCRQLCDCILQYEEKWEEKSVEMDVDIEERADVFADAELMEFVWNNLLSNALKFTEPGGTVTVRQTTGDGVVRVSVADTGCGMDAETVRRVFDKFYQGDTSHSKEGNGLGMALAYRVLKLVDGGIEVESEVGRGSKFTVTLRAGNTAG